MNRKILVGEAFRLIVPLVLVAGCVTARKNAYPEAKWINNMHRLSAGHLYVFPKAADSRKFSDPALRNQISNELREMAETATSISKDPAAPDSDPLIPYTASLFAADLRQAYVSFERNDPQMARFTISRVSRYCISCHTRSDRGFKDFRFAWNSELGGLSRAQKIEFYLANRRYRSALDEAKAMAREDDLAAKDPRQWLLTIKRTMGMIIRVNDEPAQAEELALLAFANKAAPNYARSEARSWIGDIRDWKNERRRPKSDSFKLAVSLIERQPSFIRSLRATGILHEILEDSTAPHYSEAMYYSGLASGYLRELNIGLLDQYYFESCITTRPHSSLSEKCFAQLEDSVRASNPMLSSDPDMQLASEAHLADLRRLSETKDLDSKFLRDEKRIDVQEKGP